MNIPDNATVQFHGAEVSYEEFPNTPEYEELRQNAFDLLKKRPLWWERARCGSISRSAFFNLR